MEEDLDRIASGQEERVRAGCPTSTSTGRAACKPLVDDLGDIDARDINTVVDRRRASCCASAGTGPTWRRRRRTARSRAGPSVPDDVAPDELTVEKARELLETNADGDSELGTDPDTGRTIVRATGGSART